MKIWAISDTHLSHDNADSMGFWGEVWVKHKEAIIKNWKTLINSDDIVLIGGDITWSYTMKQALTDLDTLDQLPGRKKIIVKGNHDVWWEDAKDIKKEIPPHMVALSGDAIKIDDQVFCGTTGWVAPNDPLFEPLDKNKFQKELDSLKSALDHAMTLGPEAGLHLLIHYPPFTSNGYKTKFYDAIIQYPVTTCSFGHFHMENEWQAVPQGDIDGIRFVLTATDYLNNVPVLLWEG